MTSRAAPSLTVTKFSLVVINADAGLVKSVSKRKSRPVIIPTKLLLSSTTGKPVKLRSSALRIICSIESVALTVFGLETIPLSYFLTCFTLLACSAMVIFL